MPSANTVSIIGGQLIIPFSTITKADFDILFTGTQPIAPVKAGWGWVLARQTAVPANRWVLWNGPIYRPGIYQLFPADFGFANFQYSVFVNWNQAGLSMVVTI